jgi:hypothetical protein
MPIDSVTMAAPQARTWNIDSFGGDESALEVMARL